MFPGLNPRPLDDSEESELLNKLQEIMDNGGKLPNEPSHALLLAAIRQTYKQVAQLRNYQQRVVVTLWALSVTVLLLATAFTAIHPNELLHLFGP